MGSVNRQPSQSQLLVGQHRSSESQNKTNDTSALDNKITSTANKALQEPQTWTLADRSISATRSNYQLGAKQNKLLDTILQPYGGLKGAPKKLGEVKGNALIKQSSTLASQSDTIHTIWNTHKESIQSLAQKQEGFIYADQESIEHSVKNLSESLKQADIKQGLIIDQDGEAYIRLGIVLAEGGENTVELSVKLDNMELMVLRIERDDLPPGMDDEVSEPTEDDILKRFTDSANIVSIISSGTISGRGASIQKLYAEGTISAKEPVYIDQKVIREVFNELNQDDREKILLSLSSDKDLNKELALASDVNKAMARNRIYQTSKGEDISTNSFTKLFLSPKMNRVRDAMQKGTDIQKQTSLLLKEAIEAEDLSTLSGQKVGLKSSDKELINLARETAQGAAELHKQGFLWADLKPDNYLSEGKKAVAADFGTAKNLNIEPDVKEGRLFVSGTTKFTPPEHLANPSKRSDSAKQLLSKDPKRFYQNWDVFSWGVTNYMLQSGKEPPWLDASNLAPDELEASTYTLQEKLDSNTYDRVFPEPKDKHSMDHLLWESMHPNPNKHPKMSEITNRLDKMQRKSESGISPTKQRLIAIRSAFKQRNIQVLSQSETKRRQH